MKPFYLLLLILFITGCKNEKDPETELKIDTETDSIAEIEHSKITLKDTSLYSPQFIKNLQEANYPYKITLDGKNMIIDGDSAEFPETPVIKRDYRLTGFTDTHFYQLALKRINLTTVEYDYSVYQNDDVIYSNKGKAHIVTGFFHGSETDTDYENDTGYLADEYVNNEGDCNITIRIGETDDNGRLRVKMLSNCEGYKAIGDNIILRETK